MHAIRFVYLPLPFAAFDMMSYLWIGEGLSFVYQIGFYCMNMNPGMDAMHSRYSRRVERWSGDIGRSILRMALGGRD